MKAALIQITASDDPAANLPVTQGYIAEAAAKGAQFVLTPEVTNCVSASRTRQIEVLRTEAEDKSLPAFMAQAKDLGIWLLIGSLAVKTDDPDGRFANRSFLISPRGEIVARYDKIHMFDVEVSPEETYRESAGYRPGAEAVVADTDFGRVGLTICYDIRFARLYLALAEAGARILTVPAAFSPVTGKAHWETLLRARAIETGCFVLAPAQTGTHEATGGRQRSTYGHSMAVAPWGEVLVDGGTEPGPLVFEMDLDAVDKARGRVPSLANARSFAGPARIDA
ncbi:carbon-nitrogen hydrolase family protein [Chachezhania sediminis]|uniref:carbon-nitrogen hydrolase family protein n=1 Tax=Chachezhania sediminis TaxID=2599291 RepID=UPI00131B4411|nr:carbon-nitrogen hydrolase family protein [Chachezhania sediminis]